MSNERVADFLPLPPGTDFTFQARDPWPATWLRSAAMPGCSPRGWEGYGLPVLEMACRTPVIGTPAGARAPELIAKGGGILVPPEGHAPMADAIVRFVRLPDAEWPGPVGSGTERRPPASPGTGATTLFEGAAPQADGVMTDARQFGRV